MAEENYTFSVRAALACTFAAPGTVISLLRCYLFATLFDRRLSDFSSLSASFCREQVDEEEFR